MEGWEELPTKMAAGGEYFALRIKGSSMEPKLLEGDIVIVRKQNDVDNGDTAIVLVNGDEATVKQIKKDRYRNYACRFECGSISAAFLYQ
ncbi:MAG: LexA family protein [Dialister invisus]